MEDDPYICKELKLLLENALYEVYTITDFCDVAVQIVNEHADLVLLDVTLPEESGLDICTKVRESSAIPIIFLTSNTDSMSELTGMLKGGDDYISKPFEPAILLARISAVLKRTQKTVEKQTKLEHQGLSLDMAKGCISYKGNMAELTKNEMKILHCLFLKAGKIVHREELIDYLWDNQVFIDDNTLSVHMTRIRNKLAGIGVQGIIETRRGLGYRIADITE